MPTSAVILAPIVVGPSAVIFNFVLFAAVSGARGFVFSLVFQLLIGLVCCVVFVAVIWGGLVCCEVFLGVILSGLLCCGVLVWLLGV